MENRTPASQSGLRRPGLMLLGLLAVSAAVTVGLGGALVWSVNSSVVASQSFLGLGQAASAPLKAHLGIVISRQTNAFVPRAAVLQAGGTITFQNRLDTPVLVRTAQLSPGAFAFRIARGGRASIHLEQPGLYHYYDARTSQAGHIVANNQIVTSRDSSPPRQGWVAVVPRAPTATGELTVPRGQDLFTPKVVVTIVGGSIVVQNHDEDAHNFVVDPASPVGAAFIIDGTGLEPPSGWKRVLVLQQAGLYHVYCTFHTRVVGVQDGWHVVVPRPSASGFREHNPMDAWIVALPARA